VPSTAGQSIGLVTSVLAAGASTGYYNLYGTGGTSSPIATESNAYNIAPGTSFTIKNLTVTTSSTQGGTSRVIKARVNGGAAGTPSQISCTMTSSQSTCSDSSNTYSTTANDLLDWQIVSTGSVTAETWAKVGFVMTVP
jgi:hypothetical protein